MSFWNSLAEIGGAVGGGIGGFFVGGPMGAVVGAEAGYGLVKGVETLASPTPDLPKPNPPPPPNTGQDQANAERTQGMAHGRADTQFTSPMGVSTNLAPTFNASRTLLGS